MREMNKNLWKKKITASNVVGKKMQGLQDGQGEDVQLLFFV